MASNAGKNGKITAGNISMTDTIATNNMPKGAPYCIGSSSRWLINEKALLKKSAMISRDSSSNRKYIITPAMIAIAKNAIATFLFIRMI
jgi:hypothetical protein